MADVLRLTDLRVDFHLPAGTLRAVDGVSFAIPAGSTVALVGESGSGKSVVSQAIMRIIPPPGEITSGSILFTDPRQPDARRARRSHRDHLSGADVGAVAAAYGRQPGRRGAAPASQDRRGGRTG